MSEHINKIHKNIKKKKEVLLQKGSRHNLHPKLSILDEVDCRVVYNRSLKCIFVDYDYDKETDTYRKGIYSQSFQSVIDDIEEFIQDHADIY